MNEKPSNTASGWVVVMAGLAINLILGLLYVWGVIGKVLAGSLKWTKFEATLPMSVATVCFAGMMVFAGRCQDKFGPRLVATAGGIMLGIGLIASGLAHSPIAMALTFGVGAGLGIGLGYSATTPPAVKWFPASRKGLITGIVVSGVGLAAVYMGPLTQYMLKTTSISTTLFSLGVGAMILVPLLAQLLRNPPTQPAAQTGSTSTVVSVRHESPWQEMLQTGQFYQIWLMMVLTASAGLMIIAQVPVIAKEQGQYEKGALLVAMLAIFNTVGRLLGGFVSDKIGRPRTMVLAFLLQAANMLAFSHYNSPALLIFGSSFTGLCYGTIFTLMPAATADFYGIRNLGVNYGLVFTGFGIAGVVGPLLGASIRDHFGAYDHAFRISAGMLVLGALLAMVTKPPQTQAAPAPLTTSSTPPLSNLK